MRQYARTPTRRKAAGTGCGTIALTLVGGLFALMLAIAFASSGSHSTESATPEIQTYAPVHTRQAPQAPTQRWLWVSAQSGVNFRDAPSLDAGAIGLVQGTAVEDMHATSGDFTKVAYNGAIGWVATQYVSSTPIALQAVPDLAEGSNGTVITTPNGDWAQTCPNGDCFGQPSTVNGLPLTHYVAPYTRSDGTHVGGYYRSR